MENKAPKVVLDSVTFNRGVFYQRLRKGEIGFHILWVVGNYEKAELSFLKINKGGRPLSPWETIVVENRHSSFVRTIMALSSISNAKHYWHTKDLEEGTSEAAHEKINSILSGITDLFIARALSRYF